jgi:16S rRNA (guanine527-N7)-methyltransferase
LLDLKKTEAIHGRAQDKGILRDFGGRFDIILSRAFSDLRTFLFLSYPFLKQKGTVIAMKGEVDDEETKRLMGAEGIQYRLQKTIPLVLPFSTFKRTLVLFEKS